MEYPLTVYKLDVDEKYQAVLILILMEYPLTSYQRALYNF